MAYAATTKVPVARTKAEIETIVNRYGADNFGIARKGDNHIVFFTANGKNIVFCTKQRENPQAERANWRCLAKTIHMKMESVEAGIESFEEAFLAQIVAPDGLTYGEHVIPRIGTDYTERRVPLLPNFTGE